MGTKKSECSHAPIIRFQKEDQIITITFSQEESVCMKNVHGSHRL